jgi:type IV pilus assembly protein PilV
MIEVLVAMLLCAFSLMGFAGLQAHASAMEFEALQRSQALVLLDDMVSRMTINRAGAGDYVTVGLIGDGPVQNCVTATSGSVAAIDRCEWGNLLRGSSEVQGGNRVGAMLSARGCIELGFGSSDRYVVTVVWSGIRPTSGPNSLCGLANATYPDDTMRRVVAATVCIARLRDPTTPTATPRC